MSADLKDLLAQLQVDYLKALPTKLTNIESFWKERKLQQLETEFHKLKGTGKTYGLPEISQLGQMLEHLCSAPEDTLNLAVARGLVLFRKVHESRSRGEPLPLDAQSEFQELTTLIQSFNSQKS